MSHPTPCLFRREHNGAQSQELDHLLVLLEKHTPLVSTFIHDCWAVAAQRCLTRASNMWKRQVCGLQPLHSREFCYSTLVCHVSSTLCPRSRLCRSITVTEHCSWMTSQAPSRMTAGSCTRLANGSHPERFGTRFCDRHSDPLQAWWTSVPINVITS